MKKNIVLMGLVTSVLILISTATASPLLQIKEVGETIDEENENFYVDSNLNIKRQHLPFLKFAVRITDDSYVKQLLQNMVDLLKQKVTLNSKDVESIITSLDDDSSDSAYRYVAVYSVSGFISEGEGTCKPKYKYWIPFSNFWFGKKDSYCEIYASVRHHLYEGCHRGYSYGISFNTYFPNLKEYKTNGMGIITIIRSVSKPERLPLDLVN